MFQRHLTDYQIVSIQMTCTIIRARERHVVVIIRVLDKRPVTHVFDAIANSLVSSVWVTITHIPPLTKKAHTAKKIKPVFATLCKCPDCNRPLRPHEIEMRHVCGTSKCPSSKQRHDLSRHQCYIQNPTRFEQKKSLRS